MYTYAASYDADLRLTSITERLANGGATQFGSVRNYDGAGNVVGMQTTLPAGTDHQAFCYDALNRLTWASSATGSIPCGGTNTAGTLAVASYTQSSSYDEFNRLRTGSAGTYHYGDNSHHDGVTSTSGGYSASYDADGSMTCRAPTSSVTCVGSTPTGQQLTYDGERRLRSWASVPGSTRTSETTNLYDGEGMRVEQVDTSSGTSNLAGRWANMARALPAGAGGRV